MYWNTGQTDDDSETKEKYFEVGGVVYTRESNPVVFLLSRLGLNLMFVALLFILLYSSDAVLTALGYGTVVRYTAMGVLIFVADKVVSLLENLHEERHQEQSL